MPDQNRNEKQLLENSRVFCMAPWVHLHVMQKGEVTPCCWASSHPDQVLGVLDKNTSLVDIWNNKNTKALRHNMLDEKASPKHCYRCYDLEKVGVTSMRQKMNSEFKNHFSLVQTTTAEGQLDTFHMPYVDIRFSNLCNFKCRSCGPENSSLWGQETHQKTALLRISDFYPALMSELRANLHSIEEIYFAGGEPLLMPEHFELLTELVEKKLTHIRLRYNTNFSFLSYKQKAFTDLWRHFDNIYMGASLDGSGARAEYIRKGTDWAQIEKNRALLAETNPHINFNVESTISALNVWHITDFLKDWISQEKLKPGNFFANLLQHPDYLSVQGLPLDYKKIVSKKILLFIDWLRENHPETSKSTIQSCESIVSFMNSAQEENFWKSFKKSYPHLDQIRGESLAAVFPELVSFL